MVVLVVGGTRGFLVLYPRRHRKGWPVTEWTPNRNGPRLSAGPGGLWESARYFSFFSLTLILNVAGEVVTPPPLPVASMLCSPSSASLSALRVMDFFVCPFSTVCLSPPSMWMPLGSLLNDRSTSSSNLVRVMEKSTVFVSPRSMVVAVMGGDSFNSFSPSFPLPVLLQPTPASSTVTTANESHLIVPTSFCCAGTDSSNSPRDHPPSEEVLV